MNIHLASLSRYSDFIFNTDVLPHLPLSVKKIVAIACFAFSFLAGCYLIKENCFSATLWNEEEKDWDDLSEEEMIIEDVKKEECLEIDEDLSELAEAIKNKAEQSPFPHLQTYWEANKDSLEKRQGFVHVFSTEDTPEYQAVREIFAQQVYSPLYVHKPIQWLTRREIEEQLYLGVNKKSVKALIKSCSQCFYFHSTTKENLELILKSGQLEVRKTRGLRGAFVSTVPTYFGSYILAFNRSIEHLSPLLNASTHSYRDIPEFWAGFSQYIPVNSTTLECILVDRESSGPILDCFGLNEALNHELEEIRGQCKQLLGKKIKVLTKESFMQNCYSKIVQLGMGIPSHWPDYL